MVLRIIASNNVDLPVRQAASLAFKNYVRKNWVGSYEGLRQSTWRLIGHKNEEEDEFARQRHISLETRSFIKAEIVNLMTLSPPIVQAQLSDCITMIASSDFPQKWESLIDVTMRLSVPVYLLTYHRKSSLDFPRLICRSFWVWCKQHIRFSSVGGRKHGLMLYLLRSNLYSIGSRNNIFYYSR